MVAYTHRNYSDIIYNNGIHHIDGAAANVCLSICLKIAFTRIHLVPPFLAHP